MPRQMYIVNDIDFMLKVWDLAKSRGKKQGDSVEDEFNELLKDNPGAVTFVGNTDLDADMLTGELRDQGVKVTNMNEIERQKKIKGE